MLPGAAMTDVSGSDRANNAAHSHSSAAPTPGLVVAGRGPEVEYQFEFERSMAALGTDPKLARQLLLGFYARHQHTLQTLDDALQSGATEPAHALLHSLKGTAGTLGFSEVSEAAERLESAVRKADQQRYGELLDGLGAACDPVFSALATAAAAAASPPTSAAPATGPATLGLADLQTALGRLLSQLEQMDPAAADQLDDLGPALAARGLGALSQRLHSDLAGFDFAAAEQSLRQLQSALEHADG